MKLNPKHKKIIISLELDYDTINRRIYEEICQVKQLLEKEIVKIVRNDHFWHQCLNEEVKTQLHRIFEGLASNLSYPTNFSLNLAKALEQTHKKLHQEMVEKRDDTK